MCASLINSFTPTARPFPGYKLLFSDSLETKLSCSCDREFSFKGNSELCRWESETLKVDCQPCINHMVDKVN